MAQLECRWRWRALSGAALFIWLALFGTGAGSSIQVMQEDGPVATSARPSESMPVATDCMPCAVCYVAPTPTIQGFSGECREREAPVWPVRALFVPSPTWFFDAGGYRLRWPVRIAFCRWLD